MKVTNLGNGSYMLQSEEGYELTDGEVFSTIVIIPRESLINNYREIVYVKRTIDKEIEISNEEEATLKGIKERKIEELRNICNEEIVKGFFSSCHNNVLKEFDCSYEEQININALHQLALTKSFLIQMKNSGIVLNDSQMSVLRTKLECKAKGELEFSEYTCDEVECLMLDMNNHIRKNRDKYNKLKTQVLNSVSVDEINDLSWNSED